MSSSSKLSFQSGDSPSVSRKSSPGFHGLKSLDFWRGDGSREWKHFRVPSHHLCLCTEQRGSPSIQASTLAPERVPGAPGKCPTPPPLFVPSLTLLEVQEDSSRSEPGEQQPLVHRLGTAN